MTFENPGDFYFLQILQRRKENPELLHHQQLISSFFIYSADELEHRKPEIIRFCEMFNARCYITVNRRNDEKVALMMLAELAKDIANKTYSNAKSAYLSACGKHSSDPDKKWIIDYDSKDEADIQEMMEYIKGIEPVGDKLVKVLPTKNGYHLIVKPFNKAEFSKRYNGDDIKKDNFTLLYCL